MKSFVDWLIQATQIQRESRSLALGLTVERISNVRRVNKPWGFELWLSEATDMPFALKIIHLKAGTKTSLQYHEKKKECNCLLAGTAKLHYEDPATKRITTFPLQAGEIVKVLPPAVHRIEAVSDIVLVEASSPELDDVVRVADDYQRPDGRIETEHQAQV